MSLNAFCEPGIVLGPEGFIEEKLDITPTFRGKLWTHIQKTDNSMCKIETTSIKKKFLKGYGNSHE